MSGTLHLIKLSVGTESVEGLAAWQACGCTRGADGLPRHVTRMWPRRADALLDGGSIFWVIKGAVLCRQRLLRFDAVTGADGRPHCGIVLDPMLIRTASAAKRPFQGWRYLLAADAPTDLPFGCGAAERLPAALDRALADIGVV